MRVKLKTKGGKRVEGEVVKEGDELKVSCQGKRVSFKVVKTPLGDFIAQDEFGRKFRISPVFSSKYEVVFEVDGKNYRFDVVQEGEDVEGAEGEDVFLLKAQFSGLIRKVYVRKGQKVKKGEALVDLESMKMINSLKSEIDGVVEEIYVSEGKSVMSGEKIIRIVKGEKENE